MEALEVTFRGGKKVAAHFRGHDIMTDQPVPAGGDDSAPSPSELFLASLGTCAGYYVLAFCQQRDIPVEGIRLLQTWSSDPQTHLVDEMSLEIQLPSAFPEKYRAAVARAADLCWVKRHLQNPPRIEVFARTS